MAEGISSYSANAFLNAMFNNTSFVVAQAYMQLHTAAPGAAGTTAVCVGASGSDRKSISMAAAASGAISNDTAVQWTNLTTGQDATHYTLWDATSAGNFLGSGVITANAFLAGDTLTFAIGDVDIALTIAS